MKTIIILPSTPPKWWSSLTEFCRDAGLKVNTYHKEKFPITIRDKNSEYYGQTIYKCSRSKKQK